MDVCETDVKLLAVLCVLATCLFTAAPISQAMESDSHVMTLHKEQFSVPVLRLVRKTPEGVGLADTARLSGLLAATSAPYTIRMLSYRSI